MYVERDIYITPLREKQKRLLEQPLLRRVKHAVLVQLRVEHIIGQVVDNRMALCTTWRGSFTLLAAVMKIAAHMVGLQERMKGPRYDVLGPWPVCPPHIAAQFP